MKASRHAAASTCTRRRCSTFADFGISIPQHLAGNAHAIIPAFKPEAVLESIVRDRVSDVLLVPTMIQMLVDHPAMKEGHDLSSLKRVIYGASSISEAVLDRAMKALPGVEFYQAYGMTELSPVATILPAWYHTEEGRREGKLRSGGRASFGTEVRIVDELGAPVPLGTVGEVAVRGPNVMLGYWNKPEQTAAALRGGWMHTGDGARMDADGFIYVVDRMKDMIKSGGENVFSAEVENALAQHPSVAACAVIGIPSDEWGEAVHAVVVARPGTPVAPEALIAHCRTLIAGYKCPRTIEWRDALPLSGRRQDPQDRVAPAPLGRPRHPRRISHSTPRRPTMSQNVVVAGVGMIPFTKPGASDVYPLMGARAVRLALEDARVDYGAVEQAYVGYVYGDSTAGQRVLYDVGMTGIPVVNVNNNCATGSTALWLARQAVQSGAAECVLALGFETMVPGALGLQFEDRPSPFERFDELTQELVQADVPFALRYFGGAGAAHMAQYGTRLETFAKIRRQGQPPCRAQPAGAVPQGGQCRRGDGRAGDLARRDDAPDGLPADLRRGPPRSSAPRPMRGAMACAPTCASAPRR